MPPKRLRRVFSSVFTQLLLTILLAGFAITVVAAAASIAIRVHSLGSYDLNLAAYADYVKNDLGDPPQKERAQALADRTGLIIILSGPSESWTIGETPPHFHIKRAPTWLVRPDLEVGQFLGHRFIRLGLVQGALTLIIPRAPTAEKPVIWVLAGMTLALLVILAVAYWRIRRVFSPLHDLKKGVNRLGTGDLSHRVDIMGKSEWRDLAEDFNHMAEQLERLFQDKERLLLNVSHELRSPLTRAKVALEFLPDDETKTALKEDLQHMERMISAILESARLSSPNALKSGPLDMGQLLSSVMTEFEGRPPGVVIRGSAPAPVPGDREKLALLLRNVFENAFKYSETTEKPVKVTLSQDSEKTLVGIQDYGIGISAASLPHIFKPFYREDSSRSRSTGGYGLGLSLCKAIADAHGARIDVSSREGEGTRVELTLPAARGPKPVTD